MITIRKFTLDDVASTYAYSSDFENTHYMLMVPQKSIEETRDFLAKCIAEYDKENPEYLSFAVDLDGRHIGEVFAYLSEKETDIVAYCDERNIASQKVMKNIGMEFVGSNGIRTYEKDVESWEEVKYQLKWEK